MKKRILSFFGACVLIVVLSMTAMAHSGRTDGSGGHRDNKNKSGLGSYHYHCGGYPAHLHKNGVCPYKSGGSSSSSSSGTSKPKTVYATRITAKSVPSKMNLGETALLEATVYPSNAEDKIITWESLNTGVLRVSSTGKLTAVGAGTATITAKTERGTTKKFEITVNEVLAKSISITNSGTEILVGDSKTLECKFSPENTSIKTVRWESSDESIISVSSLGKITANNHGKATITATHRNLTDSIEIEVRPIKAESVTIVFPQEIEKNDDGIPKVKKETYLLLMAEISPENASYKEVKWEVDNDTIASIDADGLFTAKEEGSVIVTASTKDGVIGKTKIVIHSNENEMATIVVFVLLALTGTGIIVWFYRKKGREETTV